MKRALWLLLAMLFPVAGLAQSTVFDCGIGQSTAWSTSVSGNNCYVDPNGYNEGGRTWVYRPNSGAVTGGAVLLVPLNSTHAGYSISPQFGGQGTSPTTNIQAFTEDLIFTWNGSNIALVWQNNGAMALASATYVSGGAFSGSGSCNLTFNNASNALGSIAVSGGTPGAITISSWGGSGNGTLPTQAFVGTCSGATGSGTVNVTTVGQCPGTFCQQFNAGAGSEAGCIQSADGPLDVPSNSLCLVLDGYDPLTNSGSFSYSSIGLYKPFEVSYLPVTTGTDYIPMFPINKISTSPVCLNGSSCSQGIASSDTFHLQVTYDHGTGILQANLWDVTAGGTCSPVTSGTCFSQQFTGVWLPEIVGSTEAYVTVTAGASGPGGAPAQTATEYINSLEFVENTPSSNSYTFTSYNANSTFNNGTLSIASPTFSLAPGTYTGTQSLTMGGVTTANGYICQAVFPAGTAVTFYPIADGNGGCQPLTGQTSGGLYAGAISLGVGSWDVYAQGAANNTAFNCPNGCDSPSGLGSSSTVVKATYTITSGSTPPTQVTPIIISELEKAIAAWI